jgi:hypothetical protein
VENGGIMDEKEKAQLINLLMEETGCEKSEAEFALSLADNNIEKAIVKLGIIQKHITVFKIKLLFAIENFYGLLHIAVNTKTLEILRFSVVFSLNPQIYEISAETEWFSFEIAIFSARLETGAMEKYTQKLEEPLKKYVQRTIKETGKMPNQEIIRAFFNPLNIKIEIIKEQVNIRDFKKLPNFDIAAPKTYPKKQDAFLHLEVKILEDNAGKPVENIHKGDSLMTLITDERDIAYYLANLIGGQKDGQMIPISAVVTDIIQNGEYFEIYLQYNTSITSYAKVKKGSRLISPIEDKEQDG